ncbi:hypothetical protein AMTRI_Chr03g147100 [Amborella trichopoda]|uniref:Uncharacterized protein n=1 Tax=Amborella trichopoda TaxID=13333 RepID=W1P167_AMBTC|nr:short-chain dehydrogenase reductase 3b [Amborella trichopoda]ERN01301.1 hypothetical protein AMTR_s00002p00253880 [Amborella trichopoda]|eukprot:XP_006838732.1 short-chain dehydrogenase reductase 3b [Amborella trichopoda]
MARESTPKKRLEGKAAIITGGASGIGEATARLFAEHGARAVVIADVQDQLGEQVAASIGDRAAFKHCDVTDEDQVKAVVEWTVQTYGCLDVMFSNAGIIGRTTSIMDLDLKGMDLLYSVNVRGMAAALKHAGKAMVDGGVRGSIVCTTSIAAAVGGVSPHDYCLTKHAVLGLVRSTCSELGKHGIRVNCVSPYGVATPLLSLALRDNGFEGDTGDIEDLCAQLSNLKGVVLRSEHVAEAVLFLASDEAAFVSGHNLAVDGGFTVVNHDFKIFP